MAEYRYLKLSKLKPHRQARLRLSRLRLSRMRPHKLGRAKVHGLRLYRLKLYGSEAGGRGGGSTKLYTPLFES